MSSWWAAIHGYAHPALDAAARDQLARMSHVMFGGLTHEPAVALASRLAELAPDGLEHVFLCDSGSVSVEVAVKMCLQYWRSPRLPGEEQAADLAGRLPRGHVHGDVGVRPRGRHAPDVGRRAAPAGVRRAAAGRASRPASTRRTRSELRRLIETGTDELAAVIVEPVVQGAGGMRFHDPGYLRVLREACDAHGVLLVFDEIATGFGRTGALFAAGHAGVSPDVMCVGKALTGGYLTLAATLCTPRGGVRHQPRRAARAGARADVHGQPAGLRGRQRLDSTCSLGPGTPDGWQAEVARIEAGLRDGLAPAAGLPGVADVRVLGAIGVVQLDREVDIAAADRGGGARPGSGCGRSAT